MSIPHKTAADVTSTILATEIVEQLLDGKSVPMYSKVYSC